MVLQESGEMYLETIQILSEKTEHVRSIDICHYMNYSKPSVSRAVNLLKAENFITIDAGGYITLTEKGEEIAKKIYERHQYLTQFLIQIGVDEETAAQDACKMEHVISDQSFHALKDFIHKNYSK